MPVVHKYTLSVAGDSYVQLPEPARVLSLQVQPQGPYGASAPVMWAQVSTDPNTVRSRRVRMLLTGQQHSAESLKGFDYIGTVQLEGLVFHYWMER